MLFLNFLTILLIVFLGLVSNIQASKGMSRSTEKATTDTIDEVSSYLALGFSNVEARGLEILTLKETLSYYLDQDLDEASEEALTMYDIISKKIINTSSIDDFIYDIHLIGLEKRGISTQLSIDETIFQSMTADGQGKQWLEAKGKIGWAGSHEFLDTKAMATDSILDKMGYAITVYRKTPMNNLMVLIDVKEDIIQSTLEKINFGEGSWSAFIAPGGKQTFIPGYKTEELLADSIEEVTATPIPTNGLAANAKMPDEYISIFKID
jgi:methyl-accepting chemotaxis protein